MKQIFDVIRRLWVAATPEEIVRQKWIQQMVDRLQFPKELIAVERELKSLPHLLLERGIMPSRRVDLLSFMKEEGGLKPLLLIECKQGLLTQGALMQAVAYNQYVQALYVAIANFSDIRLKSHVCAGFSEKAYLPSFPELVQLVGVSYG